MDSKLKILAKPIAALLGGCAIASLFMGPSAILLWFAVGWIIYGAQRYS